jgi:hypothetical protein
MAIISETDDRYKKSSNHVLIVNSSLNCMLIKTSLFRGDKLVASVIFNSTAK